MKNINALPAYKPPSPVLTELKNLVQGMISRDPDDRPYISTVLDHPLFWNDTQRLGLLRKTFDSIPDKTAQIRKIGKIVVGNTNWIELLEQDMQEVIIKEKYKGDFEQLLRFIRNKYEHLDDRKGAKKLYAKYLGSSREKDLNKFVSYWTTKYPKLILQLYIHDRPNIVAHTISPGSVQIDMANVNSLPDEFKVIIIGSSQVGKTSFAKQYAEHYFDSKITSTTAFGVETVFESLTINGEIKQIKLKIWDTVADEKFTALGDAVYRGTNGAIFMYDVTSPSSLQSIDKWHDALLKYNEANMAIAFVGNKCDLSTLVTKEDVLLKAKKLGIKQESIYEASAQGDVNVQKIFQNLTQSMWNNYVHKCNQPAGVEPTPMSTSLSIGVSTQRASNRTSSSESETCCCNCTML